jgi:hypothetical protein
VTTALTASVGTAYAYPQASDALTWAGDFDVPVSFATDELKMTHLGDEMFQINGLAIEEIRV